MSTPEMIFWSAVALPAGLAFGLFIANVFFGVDFTEFVRGRRDDE